MPVSRIHPVRHMSLKYHVLAFLCINIFLIPKLIFGFKMYHFPFEMVTLVLPKIHWQQYLWEGACEKPSLVSNMRSLWFA